VLPVVTVAGIATVFPIALLFGALHAGTWRVGIGPDRNAVVMVAGAAPQERLVLSHPGHRHRDRVAVRVGHPGDVHGHELVVRGPHLAWLSHGIAALGRLVAFRNYREPDDPEARQPRIVLHLHVETVLLAAAEGADRRRRRGR